MNTKLERRSFLEKGALGVAALAFAGGSLAKPASGGTQDLFGQVNRAKDLENMSPLEKKHVPEIHIPKKVKAGEPFEISTRISKELKIFLEIPTRTSAKPSLHSGETGSLVTFRGLMTHNSNRIKSLECLRKN